MIPEGTTVQITCCDPDKGVRYSEWTETLDHDMERGDLYRAYRDEYGRCVGRAFVDTKDGTKTVGWVFLSRQKYEDCDDTYLRETWVTLCKIIPERRIPFALAA